MEFGDKIATLCFEKYDRLGKRGKPIPKREWTLLAAVIAEIDGELRVVSLATGTKCIGVKAKRPEGCLVNDSHAEVLARRAFLHYLYTEIRKIKEEGEESRVLETTETRKYKVRDGVRWHFYTSQVPCGDASIIPMEEEEEPATKRQKLDVHRTGAKLVCGEDPKAPGMGYHKKGELRTKPGRGDRTCSLSCSDKMAKWIYTGIQGALLSILIEGSIKLSTIVIGGGGPFNKQVIYDSLITRAKTTEDIPEILQSSLVFSGSFEKVKNGRPAPASIIWSDVREKPLEVCVEGRCQGTTSKNPMKGGLKVCKLELLRNFLSLSDTNYFFTNYECIKKNFAIDYQKAYEEFKKNMGGWSKKPPGMENFTLLFNKPVEP